MDLKLKLIGITKMKPSYASVSTWELVHTMANDILKNIDQKKNANYCAILCTKDWVPSLPVDDELCGIGHELALAGSRHEKFNRFH